MLVPDKPPRKVFVPLPLILNGAFTSSKQLRRLFDEVPNEAIGAMLILKIGISVPEVVLK